MGQILGVFAKKENNVINEIPIYAEEESYYSLANIFLNAKKYVSNILQKSTLEEERKNWLQINEHEAKALLYNNVQDFADEEIQYKKSINEPLPQEFRAIKMKYESTKEEIIYSPEYIELENWSNVKTTLEAIYKIKEVLYEDLKLTIQEGERDDYKKYSFDNIQMLYSIIRTLRKREDVDEIALIYAPY